jgi:hypothetical protein
MLRRTTSVRVCILAAVSAAGIALAGPAEPALAASTLSGDVLAGGNPVVGSQVQLYAGGSAGATLLDAGTTGSGGSFELSYDPPAGQEPLYAIAAGGAVKHGASGPALRFMATAGPADDPLANVELTEQTTVASAYGLAQFLRGRTLMGPSPGLPNAAQTVSNLVEPATGKVSFVLANSPNGNATEALPTFNTLANVLAHCTLGGTAKCDELFDAAQPPGRPKPTNTLGAMLDVARFPSLHTARLFDLQRPHPYQPALSAKPNAWTLALVYTDGGFDAPGRMAFDSAGNVWSTNNFDPPGTTAGHGVTVLNPVGEPILGSPVTGGGVLGAGFGIAIDQGDNVWIGNFSGNSISELDSQGQPISPSDGYDSGGISQPQGLAVDQQGNVWIPNFGGQSGTKSVTIYRGGDPSADQIVTGGGIQKSFDIAIDSHGNAWVTNNSTSPAPGTVTKISPAGVPSSNSPISGGGMRSPQGIAVDSQDDLWVANLVSGSVTEIDEHGRIYKRSPIKAPSLLGPWGVAVDGRDNVWVAGFNGSTLTQLCGQDTDGCPPGKSTGDTISPHKTGFTSRGLQHLTAVQIDQSGNVWVANNWSTGSSLSQFVGGNGLVEFVGLAAPVKTPLIGPPEQP